MTEKIKPFIEEISDEVAFLSKLRPAKSTSVSKDQSEAGIISIINSKGNGKRLSLSAELLENLNNPMKVMVAFSDDGVVIGESIPNSIGIFTVKESGNKGMLYAGGLVDEITEEFELDFSDRTSMTFHEAHYRMLQGSPIAMIRIKNLD